MTVLTHAHGGDLDAIQRTYGIPKEEIIDFSGNINPLGFPKRAEDALKENLHLICTYPDKKYKALKQAIGTYTGADPSHIVGADFHLHPDGACKAFHHHGACLFRI